MNKVIPFIPAHLEGMKVHEWLGYIQDSLTFGYGEFLAAYPSYSVMNGGECISSLGVVPTGKDKYVAWGLLTEKSGSEMLFITREVKRFLSMFKARRIEAHVRADFTQGAKFAEVLGFKCETPQPMTAWGDDGKDYYLYSIVRS